MWVWFDIEKVLTLNKKCPKCGCNIFLDKDGCLACNDCGIVVRAINPVDFTPVGFYQENREEEVFKVFEVILCSRPNILFDDLIDEVVNICGNLEDFEVMFFKKVYDGKRVR